MLALILNVKDIILSALKVCVSIKGLRSYKLRKKDRTNLL
jgi:hypothetical protein